MNQEMILSGVGGQGILTISKVLSMTAVQLGYHLKQAEVHGMAQRGGGVQAHLRISSNALYSNLISKGQADLILSVEPLEALRYLEYLKPDGAIVSSLNPYINIPDYPDLTKVLEVISKYEHHILIDGDHLAKLAGSKLSSNIVILGAATHFLKLDLLSIQEAIKSLFKSKKKRIQEANQRAFKLGRMVGLKYLEAQKEKKTLKPLLDWISSIDRKEAEALLNQKEI